MKLAVTHACGHVGIYVFKEAARAQWVIPRMHQHACPQCLKEAYLNGTVIYVLHHGKLPEDLQQFVVDAKTPLQVGDRTVLVRGVTGFLRPSDVVDFVEESYADSRQDAHLSVIACVISRVLAQGVNCDYDVLAEPVLGWDVWPYTMFIGNLLLQQSEAELKERVRKALQQSGIGADTRVKKGA